MKTKAAVQPLWNYFLIAIFALAGAAAVSVARADCVSAPSGLAAWWPGNGNANDIIGGNNALMPASGITFGSAEAGQGFSFDGSTNQLSAPDAPSLNIGAGEDFTIEAWILPQHAPGNSPPDEMTIAYKRYAPDAYHYVGYAFYLANGGQLYFLMGDAPIQLGGLIVSAGPDLRDGNFHHVAVTLQRNSAAGGHLYVDGQSILTFDPTQHTGSLSNSEPFLIGSQSTAGYQTPFKGMIDELSLYKRALSSNEIQSIYNAGSAGKCTSSNVVSGVPVITVISPLSGYVGTSVVITGNNFSPVAASNIVYFGSVKASVTAASLTSLTVTVPVGAIYAPITVTVNGLTAYGGSSFMPTFSGGAALSSASLAPSINLSAGSGPARVVVGDIDGDGKADVVVANVYDATIWISRNISTNGSLAAASFAPPVILTVGGGSDSLFGLTLADVNGDGRLDIVVANRNFNNVSIFQNLCSPGNLSTNTFGDRVDIAVAGTPCSVASMDLDGDGKPEIITANQGSNSVSIFKNIMTGSVINTNSFVLTTNLPVSSPNWVAAADIDGDGKPDLLTGNLGSASTLSVFQNTSLTGAISFAAAINFSGLGNAGSLAVGDLDLDGKLDVVISSQSSGQAVSVYRNVSVSGSISSNSFSSRVDFATGGWANTMTIGDIDGDGKPDLAVVTQLPSHLSLFKNTSTPGSFTTSSLGSRIDFSSGWNPNGIAIGDLDGDGRPDIIFGNDYDNNVSIYRNIAPLGGVPVITAQPTNQTVTAGNTATFSVTASGSATLSYQWRFNGTNIAGATNASLVLANVQTTQAGNYAAVVTNGFGSVFSSNGVLTVTALPACFSAPAGVGAWWQGEGNVNDIVGGNIGVIHGALGYAAGQAGQAFAFDGSTSYISLPASSSLNIGTGSGVTLECWIKPSAFNVNGSGAPIIEWDSPSTDGLQIWSGGTLFANVKDTSGTSHTFQSAAGLLVTNAFQHVALTYDKSSGKALLYLNGTVVASNNFGNITPQTTYPVNIGRRTGQPVGLNDTYGGLMDELSIYNRALSSNEIIGIYAAGSGGKCVPSGPPVIISQPTNQTVLAGATATFAVGVTGAYPFNYQWRFNGTNIVGATNASLLLANVQPTLAGNYAVVVTNGFGSVISSNAVLTVTALSCTTPPAGLAAWWQAEGNANDLVGNNNGVLSNGVVFVSGKVGQAFKFNGTGAYINVASSPTLKVTGPFSIEAWVSYDSINSNNGDNIVAKGQDQEGPVDWALSVSSARKLRPHVNVGGSWIYFDCNTLLNTSVWYHVTMVYNGTNLLGYVNGVLDGSMSVSGQLQASDYALKIGAYAPVNGTLSKNWFAGRIDELSIYNRALSSNEIIGIYAAGSAGKCVPSGPPVIISQPTNQTLLTGATATFAVGVTGAYPFNYQWRFNGTNIAGATNASLLLTNVQPALAGNYAVVVTNSFGLATSSNAVLTVTIITPSCTTPPSGLAAWWPGEGNANDAGGANNGVVEGTLGYGLGKVGQAFLFNTTNADVWIPASGSLNVGISNGFTLEAWINPANVSSVNPIFEWNTGDGVTYWGVHFHVLSGGQLYANVIPASGGWRQIFSPLGVVTSNVFQHVALTYDKSTGVATLYCNGAAVASQNLGVFTPLTTYPLYLGRRPMTVGESYTFAGLIDEPTVYSRALSSNEIIAVFNAGSGGKCVPSGPPVILTQPANQTVTAGSAAAFTVGVTGTFPFSYQWSLNGTNLVGATNASLTLANVQAAQAGNYAVVVTNTLGTVTSSNALLIVNVIAPAITSQPLSRTVVTGTNVTFTVGASGSAPLFYQWFYNSSNLIAGATNASLTLSNVLVSQAGNYSVVVSNGAGSATSSNAVLTVALPTARVMVVSTNVASGGTVTVPVVLVANGNENALGFSLGFNPQRLTLTGVTLGSGAPGAFLSTNSGSGIVGVAIIYADGATTFAPGTQTVAVVTFNAPVLSSTTQSLAVAVGFSNAPVVSQISDVNSTPLPAIFVNGTVTLQPVDLEGDVAPRPTGSLNHVITITDWVQEGRFVAGLDTPAAGGEFQRADVAPRGNLGNGQINVTDWVQVGRYAVGLDPLTAVGGPTSLNSSKVVAQTTTVQPKVLTRVLQVIAPTNAIKGLTTTLAVNLQSQGDESALTFSLNFDPAAFQYYGISLGSAASGATLLVNTNAIATGKLGVALELPFGSAFTAGSQEIVKVSLVPLAASTGGGYATSFGDAPVPRAMSDAIANELTASYALASVSVNGLPPLTITPVGTNAVVSWPAWAQGFTLQACASDLISSGNWTNADVSLLQTNGGNLTVTVPLSGQTLFFRLQHP